MIEQALVKHVASASLETLPEEARRAARRETLWTLGTSVAGAGAEDSELIREFALQLGGTPEATVIGFGDRLPASVAGFANGCFAKALEYEDKFWMDGGHGYAIATSVVPAALAAAERVGGVSGADFLTAVAVATDVQARLVRAVSGMIDGGWNATYLYGVFGATIAAAKLMRLDEERLADALGLAFAQAAGNFQGQVEAVLGVRLQGGFAVRNALSSAQLAALGATGTHEFLTGKFGLYRLHFDPRDVDEGSVTDGLGEEFLGVRLGYKAYPCGAVVHPALDALRDLGDKVPAPEDIAGIRVLGTRRMEIMADPLEHRQNPRSHIEAQFSIPWVIACMAVDGRLSLSHYGPDALADPRLRELARRVTVEMDPDRPGASVEIETTGGEVVVSASVPVPRGHGDNPLTTEEMVAAFHDCVQHGPGEITPDRASEAVDRILRLEELETVEQLVALLV